MSYFDFIFSENGYLLLICLYMIAMIYIFWKVPFEYDVYDYNQDKNITQEGFEVYEFNIEN
jgi:hypothetical protein